MKKTVEVTITKQIEVNIPDEMLTESALKEFSSCIYTVVVIEELFKHAAECIVKHYSTFIEGIGDVGYVEVYEDVESEIIS